MSYEPTNWKDGDLVTSAKLNKIEQGIANNAAILIVNSESQNDSLILNKTWKEITESTFAILKYNDGVSDIFYPLYSYNNHNGKYDITFCEAHNGYFLYFGTTDINGYPKLYEEEESNTNMPE